MGGDEGEKAGFPKHTLQSFFIDLIINNMLPNSYHSVC